MSEFKLIDTKAFRIFSYLFSAGITAYLYHEGDYAWAIFVGFNTLWCWKALP